MASITSRGEGVWEVSACRGRRQDGRQNRISKRVHGTYADAEIVGAQLDLQLGAVQPTETLDEYFSRRFIPSRSDLDPKTIDNYRTIWRCHVSPAFGSMPVSEPPHADIQRWALSMSRGTSVHAVKLLRCVLRDAWYAGLLPSEPMARPVRYPKLHAGKADVWDADEVSDAMRRLRGHRLEPLVAVMLGGGLRRSEALALDWGDLRFGDGLVRLTVSKAASREDGMTKNPQSVRAVSIGEPFASALERRRGAGPICPLKPDGVRSLWKRMFASGGTLGDMRYIPMKQLRATHTTLMHEAGVSDTTISMVHGHSDVRTDYRHYIAPTSRAADDAARAVCGFMRCRDKESRPPREAMTCRDSWSGGLDSNQRPLDPQSSWTIL